MKYGLSEIVKCPYCGEAKKLLSLASGNSINAKYWSDMKMSAPMMPEVSPVQKCPKCGCYYLKYKQQWYEGKDENGELGELSYPEWKEAYNQFCNEDKVNNAKAKKFSFFKKGKNEQVKSKLDDKDWSNIRLWLIQSYNDFYYRSFEELIIKPRNFELPNPPEEEYDFIVGVINEFINSNNWEKSEKLLLKAELYRESQQFDKCKETLLTIDSSKIDRFDFLIYRDIMERNNKCDNKVFRILDEKERMKIELLEEMKKAKKAKEEWVAKESQDTRYKSCTNGHCFKNLDYSCRWCAGKNSDKRLDEKTPITTIDIYMGAYDGNIVLTTNPDIGGKNDYIRKITVDMVGNYKLYYHLDGKNPNPFYSNTIRLNNEITIKGGDLVRSCDALIDGNLDEIIIDTNNH